MVYSMQLLTLCLAAEKSQTVAQLAIMSRSTRYLGEEFRRSGRLCIYKYSSETELVLVQRERRGPKYTEVGKMQGSVRPTTGED